MANTKEKEKGKSKYFSSLRKLSSEDLELVREDISMIVLTRQEEDVIEKIANRAAEIAVAQLGNAKWKKETTKKLNEEEDEDEEANNG